MIIRLYPDKGRRERRAREFSPCRWFRERALELRLGHDRNHNAAAAPGAGLAGRGDDARPCIPVGMGLVDRPAIAGEARSPFNRVYASMPVIPKNRTTAAAAALALLFASSMLALAQADGKMTMGERQKISGNIMGDHLMMPGRCMFTLSHSFMNMAGNREGNSDLSRADVHKDFVVSPTSMLIRMSALGFMCGASDKLTLMGMVPGIRKSMDLQARNGARFSTRSSGMGDIRLMAAWKPFSKKRGDKTSEAYVNLGATLPTGSIDKKDQTPMGRARLPYPMQLGSGTVDPLLAVHYAQRTKNWGWGAHTQALFRLGRNSHGYRLGHDYRFNLWLGRRLHATTIAGARLAGHVWRNVSGRDSGLNPAIVPTARADLRAGERADLSLAAEWKNKNALMGVNRFIVEVGVPIHQNLEGPQLKKSYHGKLSWIHMF